MLEYNDNCKTFEDPDIISLDTIESEHFKTVTEEIERGRRLNEERHYWKKEKRPEIRPLFEKELKNFKNDRPVMYRYIEEKLTPKLDLVCRHFGNFTLDRSILTRDEHINFLSQPRCIKYPIRKDIIKAHYKKIFLPNLTARIEELATPNLRLMENTMKKFSQHLNVRQLDNLTHFIAGRHREKITTVDRAITLMQEEKHQKELIRKKLKRELEAVREKIQFKRLQQVQQIVWSLFEVMKDYLMTEHAINLKSEMNLLSNLVVYNLAEFAGYDVPSSKSQEFIDKFIIDLSDNLSIWLDKFTTNFGFRPLVKEGPLPKRKLMIRKDSKSTLRDSDKISSCHRIDTDMIDDTKKRKNTIDDFKDGKGSIYLPIDDYIPLSDSSFSDLEGFWSNKICEEEENESESEDFLLCEEEGEEGTKTPKSNKQI